MAVTIKLALTMNLQIQLTYKQLLKIALPISFAILIPQLNFIINTIFLGNLGDKELGLAGITGVYYLIFSSIGYGLNNGLQSLISNKAGQNDKDGIGQLFIQGIYLALACSLMGIIITYTILPQVLHFFLSNDVQVSDALQFLKIRIWGLPFLYVYQMRNALLVGINKSKYLPYGTAAETIANVGLDYIFIFGALGFSAIGFNGAAYASIIAEFIGMVVTFGIIKYKGITRQFSLFEATTLKYSIIKTVLKQSAPLMLQHALSIVSWFVFYLLIGRMANSTMQLAISNTMRSLFGFFGVFIWAMGSTTNTVISNLLGQGKQDLVPKAIKMLCIIGTSFTVILLIILNIFPASIFKIFSHNTGYVAYAIPVMRVVAVAMLVMSIAIVFLNTIIAYGKSIIAFYIEAITITAYIIYIYLVVEHFKLSLPLAWMSEWLYWSVLITFSVGYYYKFLHNQKL